MKSLGVTSAILTCAAFALSLSPGTANARDTAPATGARAATATATSANNLAVNTTSANLCTSGTLSGRSVAGARSPEQVARHLGSLTEEHRAARGYVPGKGAKGALAAPGDRATARTAPAGGTVAAAPTIHPAQGTAFKRLQGSDGACATQSVSTQVRVRDTDTTIYTPTLYPAGGSCVELVTVYNRGEASVSAWDWCRSIIFKASVPIDSSFLSTYTDGSSSAYTGRVTRTSASGNTWAADLYNHRTRSWDRLYSQSGTTQARYDGWDIYEIYSSVGSSGRAGSCDAMAGITFDSSNISVRANGVWSAASPANSDTGYDAPNSAFSCPTRTYRMVNAYDHWTAVG
ncbi:hypothetical protein NX801_22370 [Streptomyces sp. LP05-1]|uniref:Secreted protein n=1 Tax=Streptomyces pyxinae TaxID=2970734 RepID=A0ABT2CLP1_9ACTN|nr:hypothetical protein [Streptomyces sp. LP05-1]MCS0638348.1 hypothetical protein [Streptomyces sp. LP05-1]